MANIASARKRARQAAIRRLHNAGLKSRLRTHIKNVLKAVQKGDKEQAQAAFKAAEPIINAGVNKGLIHRNNAARKKSRLNARIKAM